MFVFEQAVSVITEAERVVIGSPLRATNKTLSMVLDALLHVPMFIIGGLQLRMTALFFGAVMMPVWWVLITLAMWVFGDAHTQVFLMHQGWIVAGVLATSSILFPLPSRSTQHGVISSQVDAVAAHILSIAADKATIELIQKGVASIDATGTQRITRLNWFLGLFWGGLGWATARWILASNVPAATQHQALPVILGSSLAFVFIALGSTSYEVAVRTLKQTVEFAFLQALDAVEKQSIPSERLASVPLLVVNEPPSEEIIIIK